MHIFFLFLVAVTSFLWGQAFYFIWISSRFSAEVLDDWNIKLEEILVYRKFVRDIPEGKRLIKKIEQFQKRIAKLC